MNDRRRNPRYNESLRVDYYPAASEIIYSTTTTKNISRGGICIPVLPRLVRKGDYIKLDIFPREGATAISATGKVMWTRETNALNNSPFEQEAGIEFTDVEPALIENIIRPLAS